MTELKTQIKTKLNNLGDLERTFAPEIRLVRQFYFSILKKLIDKIDLI